MYADLKGKTALVTGAGKKAGIGYAIAQKMAENGVNVVIADLVKNNGDNEPPDSANHEEMMALADDLSRRFGTKATFIAVDVTSASSIRQLAEEIQPQFEIQGPL